MRFRLGAQDEAVRRRVERLEAPGGVERVWQRDAVFWGGDAARRASVSKRLGWVGLAEHMQAYAPDIRAFAGQAQEGGFTSAVLLGMGGSSLAPEVLRLSIEPRDGYPCLHVLDTTDPATILAVQRQIDIPRTLFVVSSKSGTTIEVTSLSAHFFQLVAETKGSRAGENFVAITDDGTALRKLADEKAFRARFINPSDIGGRYSALSYFGLVPAALAGIDIDRLLERAADEERSAREPGSGAVRLGATLAEMALAGRDKCTLVVAPEVDALGLWLEQLLAESTGKEGLGIVPVAGEPLGTPRSYGGDRLFVQVRLEAGYTGEQDSVVGALVNEGQPAARMEMEDIYALGAQFVRWEAATAIAGQILGINPFDEPNVQESKDNTSRVLREIDASGGLPARDADGIGQLASLLEGLRPPAYFAITAYVQQTPRTDAAFGAIRALVRDATGVATTLGYGPRFLHSTGQIHKGGPPTGVFLQITGDDAEDITIPGKPYTFGQLKCAQAIGDLESLRARGRPAVRVHLAGDIAAGLGGLVESVRSLLGA